MSQISQTKTFVKSNSWSFFSESLFLFLEVKSRDLFLLNNYLCWYLNIKPKHMIFCSYNLFLKNVMTIVETQKSIFFPHQENKKIMHFRHILIFFQNKSSEILCFATKIRPLKISLIVFLTSSWFITGLRLEPGQSHESFTKENNSRTVPEMGSIWIISLIN